ncbi:hypothetical protein Sxan_22400 [Streptomyces xanthophaeus]|uniref:Uncharacterized protein n=1 Tax=Streptomyces xanthophaeus TaxID=67385 RepID=A0A919LC99_9ACTN|nr:hypothetical protein Sxan_22400 [Streptomyces xanthophaeus]
MVSTLWIMRGLFADRIFLGHVLTNGFAYAALFSYIAASPFVIQEIYGASPQTFALLFGLNSLGLMIVGQVNGRLLVGKVRLDKVLGTGLSLMAVAGTGLLLVAGGAFGDVATVPIAIGLFVLISSLGLVLPNTQALGLMRTPHSAGSASALLGTSCYVFGAAGSLVIGMAGKGSAVPMATISCAARWPRSPASRCCAVLAEPEVGADQALSTTPDSTVPDPSNGSGTVLSGLSGCRLRGGMRRRGSARHLPLRRKDQGGFQEDAGGGLLPDRRELRPGAPLLPPAGLGGDHGPRTG